MFSRSFPSTTPAHLWILLVIYFIASLVHFTHNAEFIALYPNMPEGLTRETVYLAWLAVTAVGMAGLVLARTGLRLLGALGLAVYGLLGLDGLLHYTLALCSEHSLAMNLTIWWEVVAGVALAAGSLKLLR